MLEHPFLANCDATKETIVTLMEAVNTLAQELLDAAEAEEDVNLMQTALKTSRAKPQFEEEQQRQQIIQQQLRALKSFQKVQQQEKIAKKEEHSLEIQKLIKKQEQHKLHQFKAFQTQEQHKKEHAEKETRSQCEKRLETELADLEEKSSNQKEEKGWKGLFTLTKSSPSAKSKTGTITLRDNQSLAGVQSGVLAAGTATLSVGFPVSVSTPLSIDTTILAWQRQQQQSQTTISEGPFWNNNRQK